MGRRGRSNVINVCFVSCETTVGARVRARAREMTRFRARGKKVTSPVFVSRRESRKLLATT